MNEYADLEIELQRFDNEDEDLYQIDMRFSEPGRDSTNTLPGGPYSMHIDNTVLLQQETNIDEYGRLLSNMLFAPEAVKTAFIRARSDVEARGSRLRVRLRVRENAAALHNLRWETVRDPLDESKTLLTNESILFSRFVDSADWRRADLRPRQELRALIVVANPADLNQYKLAEIDVAGEVARAQAGLGSQIPTTVLASGGQATVETIFAELNQGYDILYLVAHGRFRKGVASVFLEDAGGNVDRVNGDDLVRRFADMWQRPRLILLASCESAGKGRSMQDVSGPLAAIGPQLAREGIPAVLAMQGTISMETVEKFMPIFFETLRDQEEIDTAMTVARNHIRDQDDWWMPVLYSRLKSGRISWYQAGFADDTGFKWRTLINLLQKETIPCTPIVGSGLSEPLFGSHRELAQEWAQKYGFPLAPRNRDDLPQVTQFLDVSEDRGFILDEFVIYLGNEIRRRHREYLSPELLAENLEAMDEDEQLETLNDLLTAVWDKHESLNDNDPYRALARLNFPLYINTGTSDLLANALRQEGKDPQMAICPWNDAAYADIQEEFDLSKDRPLVYHMFGHLSDRESLVLTEDDYFDYLIGITDNKKLIPHQIRAAITNQTTLILGLTFNTWESRILFRVIMNQGGSRRRRRKTHLSAQIAPTRPDVKEPKLARRYLEDYFGADAINIFWGKPEDFIHSLHDKLYGGLS